MPLEAVYTVSVLHREDRSFVYIVENEARPVLYSQSCFSVQAFSMYIRYFRL